MKNSIDGDELIAFDAVLRLFGPDIRELSFNASDNAIASRHFFDILIANCSPLNFKSLRLVNTKLTEMDALRCRHLLERLEKIELIGCFGSLDHAYGAFVSPCEQLKTLTLVNLFSVYIQWSLPMVYYRAAGIVALAEMLQFPG